MNGRKRTLSGRKTGPRVWLLSSNVGDWQGQTHEDPSGWKEVMAWCEESAPQPTNLLLRSTNGN